MRDMSNLIEDAVKVLRELPANVQEVAARAILDYGAGQDDELMLSDAQAAEIERRITDPDREFISVAEARDRLRPFGV